MNGQWPTKDPDEVLDYANDWATLRLEEGETLAQSAFFVDEGDVVIDSSSFTDGVATVWLSGGTAGLNNKITNRVLTSRGRTYEVTLGLRVRSTA